MGDLTPRERLIVALDVDERDAFVLANELKGIVSWVKVGMTLFYGSGPQAVARLRDMGFEVFVDLKLHDIPHQTAGAARAIGSLGAGMLTVHASGGAAMITAAVEGARLGASDAGMPAPRVVAVTVLTSMDDEGLASVGVARAAAEQVAWLAQVASDAGADGVVCSPSEAAVMRELLGSAALIVTPGVRPQGADIGDQARVATPSAALQAGASHLVVGRPITAVSSPAEAAEKIISEMEGTA